MKENRKSIAFLDFDDIKNPLLGAGQATTTAQLGKRLVKMGNDVTVYCAKYPGWKDRIENGIRYTHVGLNTGNIKLNNILYIFTIPFIVPKISADVIFECFTAPISTLCSPLWTSIPVVVIPSMFDAYRFFKKYHIPFHVIERFGLPLYKYFLPFTEYLDKKMKKANPNIVSQIVPEGVDDYFFTIKRRKPKHILFIGRFDIEQKGIDLLLQAYAKVVHTIGYPLVVAGFGPDEQQVKQLIQKYNLTDSVILPGPAYGKKKEKLLAESLYVVIPSRDETFSCFSLEVLASGNPLITFDIPGLEWLKTKGSIKVPPFDTDILARRMLSLTDQTIHASMSRNGRMYAKLFTWDKMAEKYDAFLKNYVYSIHTHKAIAPQI